MKDTLVSIKNEEDYKKDATSGAIINVNRAKVERERKVADERRKSKAELEELKSEVKDIKQMLSQIVEKLQ